MILAKQMIRWARGMGFCVAMAVLLFAYKAQAAPAYGTRMPERFQWFVGGQTHYVSERTLEGDHGEIRGLQHFLNLSFGVTDWLCLDVKGGAGNIRHERISGRDLAYPTFVGGGYGFRLRLYEQAKTKAVFGFQHISIHPYTRNVGEDKHKSVLDDWQLSCLVSYAVNQKWTPYAGAKVSRMDHIYWKNGERDRIKSDESRAWGMVLGTDWNVTERVWINVEAQALDVEAVSASVNIEF